MRRNWYRVTAVIAMITMLFLTACSSSATAPTPTATGGTANDPSVLDAKKHYSIDFYEVFGTGANKTALEDLTQQYTKKNPNVTVNLQPYDSYPTLQTKINAAIAAHTPPAIAQVYENWAVQYQQAGQIVSLQPYIAGKNGLSKSDIADFYPSLLSDGKIDNTQYMLPFNKSDEVVYYNADALQKLGISPPTTQQQFIDDLTRVTTGSQWGLSLTPSVDEWSILYKALGGKKFVSDDGKTVSFAKDPDKTFAQGALEALVPLVKSGAVHVTQQYAWQNDFASQKSVFALSTIASYPFLDAAIKGSFKFGEAPIPAGPAGQYTVLFGTNLALFKGVSDDTRAAAWDYMKFLTSASANTSFVKQTGYMPIRKSAYNSTELQQYFTEVPARKVGPQQIPNAFVASFLPGWQTCRNDIGSNFTSVLKGQDTSDAALAKMVQKCNDDLSQ